MTKEFEEGRMHAKAGYSAHYNPYRHRGTAKQFLDWRDGHRSAAPDSAAR